MFKIWLTKPWLSIWHGTKRQQEGKIMSKEESKPESEIAKKVTDDQTIQSAKTATEAKVVNQAAKRADDRGESLFVLIRGVALDDHNQLVQMIVPGFNLVDAFHGPTKLPQAMLEDHLTKFRAQAWQQVSAWQKKLAENDGQAPDGDQLTFDTCWLVNRAIEQGVTRLQTKRTTDDEAQTY